MFNLIILLSSTCFEHPSFHPQAHLYMMFYGILSCIRISRLVNGTMCLVLSARKYISHMRKEHKLRVCNMICTAAALHFGLDEDS